MRATKRTRWLAWGLVLATMLALVAPFVAAPQRAAAASGSDFDPGFIISDANFYDSDAMSVAEVQQFLNAKRPTCTAGYVCLKNYRQTTWTRPADAMCARYGGLANEPAAQIIARVGAACGINPQVLIVLLEKEQSLVTSSAPTATRYQRATGFACPDTAPCDVEFSGFYNQVYKAAWQYKRYTNPAGTAKTFTWFPVGQTSNVRFHPNAACGSRSVLIRNVATASLYYYTPYQPNAAALGNMYGIGDNCSAYGNRNFWRLFSDWFGSPTGPVNPIGNVEQAKGMAGGVQVSGWAADANSSSPIDVHVYLGGVSVAVKASGSRPDVAAVYPEFGANRGYSTFIAAPPGTYQACAWGINTGPGSHTSFGCHSVTVPTGPPTGALETASVSDGRLTVRGWGQDPDSVNTLAVHVYVDSSGWSIRADKPRTDLPANPRFGTSRGYEVTLPVTPGTHRVCTYGINIGPGSNALFGCKTIEVPVSTVDRGTAPVGNFEGVRIDGAGVRVSGWALDPDAAASIPVHVYVNGVGHAIRADLERGDVGAAYPGYGNRHGFSATVPAKPGSNSVCAYGINGGRGTHTLLGCKTISVPSSAPVGNLEAVTAANGAITAEGWTLSRTSSASIPVHVYVDGVGTPFTADIPRPDVQSVFPALGADHGFKATLKAAKGTHRVCVWGIDKVRYQHTLLGCRSVTI